MKLTYEDGHIVLRKENGTLFWSTHNIDIKDEGGGYKEIIITGELQETNTITGLVKKFEL